MARWESEPWTPRRASQVIRPATVVRLHEQEKLRQTNSHHHTGLPLYRLLPMTKIHFLDIFNRCRTAENPDAGQHEVKTWGLTWAWKLLRTGATISRTSCRQRKDRVSAISILQKLHLFQNRSGPVEAQTAPRVRGMKNL